MTWIWLIRPNFNFSFFYKHTLFIIISYEWDLIFFWNSIELKFLTWKHAILFSYLTGKKLMRRKKGKDFYRQIFHRQMWHSIFFLDNFYQMNFQILNTFFSSKISFGTKKKTSKLKFKAGYEIPWVIRLKFYFPISTHYYSWAAP